MYDQESRLAGWRAGERFARLFPIEFMQVIAEVSPVGVSVAEMLARWARYAQTGQPNDFEEIEQSLLAVAAYDFLSLRPVTETVGDAARFIEQFPYGYRAVLERLEWELALEAARTVVEEEEALLPA